MIGGYLNVTKLRLYLSLGHLSSGQFSFVKFSFRHFIFSAALLVAVSAVVGSAQAQPAKGAKSNPLSQIDFDDEAAATPEPAKKTADESEDEESYDGDAEELEIEDDEEDVDLQEEADEGPESLEVINGANMIDQLKPGAESATASPSPTPSAKKNFRSQISEF